MKVIGKEYQIIQLDGGPEAGKYVIFSRDVYDLKYTNGTNATSYWTNTDHSDDVFDSELVAKEYINSLKGANEKV